MRDTIYSPKAQKYAKKLMVFAVILAMLFTLSISTGASAVYGATDPAITPQTWKVTFLDIDGSVLKEEIVNDGEDATPPVIKAKKGYKFLGWNEWYVNVTSDRKIQAVYELVMTTEPEQEGKLATAGTAEPPAEDLSQIAIATEGGLEVIDITEAPETTSSVIKDNPTPTTVVESPQKPLSATTIVLIAVAAFVAVALAAYVILMTIRKRRAAR